MTPRCTHVLPLNQGPTPCHLAGHWLVGCGCGCETEVRVCTGDLPQGYKTVSACPTFTGQATMATELDLWRAK
jgi:hypothetical protein